MSVKLIKVNIIWSVESSFSHPNSGILSNVMKTDIYLTFAMELAHDLCHVILLTFCLVKFLENIIIM